MYVDFSVRLLQLLIKSSHYLRVHSVPHACILLFICSFDGVLIVTRHNTLRKQTVQDAFLNNLISKILNLTRTLVASVRKQELIKTVNTKLLQLRYSFSLTTFRSTQPCFSLWQTTNISDKFMIKWEELLRFPLSVCKRNGQVSYLCYISTVLFNHNTFETRKTEK